MTIGICMKITCQSTRHWATSIWRWHFPICNYGNGKCICRSPWKINGTAACWPKIQVTRIKIQLRFIHHLLNSTYPTNKIKHYFNLQRTLLDTNPYLLALTVVITLVHNVFEFLAFKNGKNIFKPSSKMFKF